jgi:hypothetical protein
MITDIAQKGSVDMENNDLVKFVEAKKKVYIM